MDAAVRERLLELLRAARSLADPNHALGREARVRLTHSSGLSKENVEWALTCALETHPSEAELELLAASVEKTPRSHVLLSANVFVGAHRAIALALAASSEVYVRPSRREPEMTELLAAAAPGLFQRVQELRPLSGEQLFAYGRSETLRDVAQTLPSGVTLHGHGPGFGLIVVSGAARNGAALEELAGRIAVDIAAFDQRGCLSPRLLLVEGSYERGVEIAREVALALGVRERSVPLGELTALEMAEIARYRATMAYSGDLFSAGSGYVAVGPPGASLELAPVGRNLHVFSVADARAIVRPLAAAITTFAYEGSPEGEAELARALPGARKTRIGEMQTPRFDGPVDLRSARGVPPLRANTREAGNR
jgi:hypothetical protein